MIRRFTNKRAAVGLGAIVAAAALAVGAFAYFTNTGTKTGTPVTVGTIPPNSFTVAFGSTTYSGGNASLLPSPKAPDVNADVATVEFTVENNSEASEILNSYTIEIPATWKSDENEGQPACTAADFSINGGALGASSTEPVAADDLSPNSDGAPADTYSGTFKIQLVDNDANQDNCARAVPEVTVSATS